MKMFPSFEMKQVIFGISLLLLLVLRRVSGEFITANVTKFHVNNSKVFLSTTTIAPPVDSDRSVPHTRNASEVPAAILSVPSPKVVSVNADSRTGYAVFPMTSAFHFPESEGVEETYTYQVKQQRRPSNVAPPIDFRIPFNFVNAKTSSSGSEPSAEIQNYVKELNQRMDEKVRNLTAAVHLISVSMSGNITQLNSSFLELSTQVSNLTTLSKETSRSLMLLQYIHDKEKTAFLELILNLTENVEKMRVEAAADIRKLGASFTNLQGKLENTTQEVRVHESYLRYGQQTMASLKTSIDKNTDKIAGFEADGGPQWIDQTNGCGGVVTANSGIISYKFRQAYFNNERCIWIIRTNRRSKINLQLLEDGFQNQSNSDFLTVTEFAEDQHPVTLITSSRLEHGNNVLHTFQGPVIFVTFYSDASLPGTGFSLKFDGTGNRTDGSTINAIRHLNLHLSDQFGIFVYPEDRTITYQPNELVTLAINPRNATSLKIHMKMSDLEKDEYCEFDSISLYGSVTGSYALTKRYCQQGENFNGEAVQSSDGLFLVIFRSDASTQFGGFEFQWEME